MTTKAGHLQIGFSKLGDLIVCVVLLGAAVWVGLVEQAMYLSTIMTTGALFAIAAIGLNILFGYAGDLSLGQAGFLAIGSYFTVVLSNRLKLPYLATGVVAIFVAAGVALLVGMAVLRARGLYFAVITVAVGLVAHSLASQWISITGGPQGIFVALPLTIGGNPLTAGQVLVVVGVLLSVVYWLSANLTRHHFGRAWKATQSSPLAAESVGLNTYGLRLLAFVICGFLGGLAGALLPIQTNFIYSETYTLSYSVFILLTVLVGGAGSRLGPLIGAGLLTAFLQTIGTRLGILTTVVYGALFLVIIYVAPDGVMGLISKVWRWSRSLVSPATPRHAEEQPSATSQASGWTLLPRERVTEKGPAGVPLLLATGISKSFAGVKALDDAQLAVDEGTIHGIIGANGSGKSTLLNILSGIYTCDAGTVLLAGEEIQNQRPYRVSRRGIARTFQTSELFAGLTLVENVMTASEITQGGTFLGYLFGTPASRRAEREARKEALDFLSSVGLAALADEPVERLGAGQARLLEVARALATNPRIIFLDEPAAGLDAAEVELLAATLKNVRAAGVTCLVVEHRMELMASIADRVTVLDGGRTIAQGLPAEIQNDQAVIVAYLGEISLV